jgi:transcriptional regulator with XRE-family HTH domain
MDEITDQRHVVRGNLATHAATARTRMGLSLSDTARLARLTPETIEAVENGTACSYPLALLTHLALFLGLTELGLPRRRPPGSD